MSYVVRVTQRLPETDVLGKGHAAIQVDGLESSFDDARLRIYDHSRQQYLQPNGDFGDTAEMLQPERLLHDSEKRSGYLILAPTIVAAIDPFSPVTIEIPKIGVRERLEWPELVAGGGPSLPEETGRRKDYWKAKSRGQSDEDGAAPSTTGGGQEPDDNLVVGTPEPATQPTGRNLTIAVALVIGIIVGAAAVWFIEPADRASNDAVTNNDEVDRIQQSLDDAKTQLAQARQSRDEIQHQLTDLQRANEDTVRRADDAEKALMQAREQFGQGETDAIGQANAERDSARETARRSEARAQAAERKAEAAQANRAAALGELERLERRFDEERRRADQAVSALARAEDDLEEARRKLPPGSPSDTERLLREAERRATQAEAELSQYRDRTRRAICDQPTGASSIAREYGLRSTGKIRSFNTLICIDNFSCQSAFRQVLGEVEHRRNRTRIDEICPF